MFLLLEIVICMEYQTGFDDDDDDDELLGWVQNDLMNGCRYNKTKDARRCEISHRQDGLSCIYRAYTVHAFESEQVRTQRKDQSRCPKVLKSPLSAS